VINWKLPVGGFKRLMTTVLMVPVFEIQLDGFRDGNPFMERNNRSAGYNFPP
jgi:hypothetical protein